MRLQSTEAYERLNTNLQSYGGQIASVRLETIERLTNVRQNFNTKNAAAETVGFKKKNRQGELCNGERANCIAQIAIPRATTIPAEKFGVGNFQTLHQVCLIISKLQYLMIA